MCIQTQAAQRTQIVNCRRAADEVARLAQLKQTARGVLGNTLRLGSNDANDSDHETSGNSPKAKVVASIADATIASSESGLAHADGILRFDISNAHCFSEEDGAMAAACPPLHTLFPVSLSYLSPISPFMAIQNPQCALTGRIY